ncbi:hypothetical protein VJ923_04170 [Adlercreutzia sp. R25]|uniref:Uncharacterized protein n=1 Tax=Adlercreutzia shanghongiae TaxID=3111773 RepID=A0ABU6IWL1_9ACTN|nr:MULTISPECIES: hypothetical protein [unclassified Adlercreutzia]MEC4272356.1 hypothetical protein [Adlercreutzia sp. R25]MEC4294222.1 hypothetical protein [Adlercreutzia sp. R22]
MKCTIVKASSAVLGAAVLATSGVALASPLLAQESTDFVMVAQEAAHQNDAEKAPAKVEGDFSFSQSAVTSTSEFSQVFLKAASSLCASLPDYAVNGCSDLAVSVNGVTKIDGTIDDLIEEQGAVGSLMACACASNIPGGGAVANVGASGVSLESIAQAAGAMA